MDKHDTQEENNITFNETEEIYFFFSIRSKTAQRDIQTGEDLG